MEIKSIFTPKGLLDKHFESYEHRPQQTEMAELIVSAIKSNRSAVIEGATGSGKSFAYLVPLIASGKRAIISTSNKSLQDQLSKKDLPALKKVLSTEFNWTVLKGKNNYFCHEHFQMHKSELKKLLSRYELSAIAKWAEKTKDGDIEYYPTELPPRVKELITCDTETVHPKDSPFYELCFAVKARARALESQIVLINHTLLALDMALRIKTEGKVSFLPKAEVVIVDEAHTFERYATMAFSDAVNMYSLYHLTSQEIVRACVPRQKLRKLSEAFSTNLNRFLPEKGEVYYQQKKVACFDGFKPIVEQIEEVLEMIGSSPKTQKDDVEQKKVKEILKEGRNLIERLEVLGNKDDDMLRWSEARERPDKSVVITLKSVPLTISNILENALFGDKVVVCTSATLAVDKSFDFFRHQLGVPENAFEMIVDSPFDYKKNALIYISSGEQEKYWEVEQLIKSSKGNAFVLFTSYRDMHETYQAVDIDYPKLVQREGISRAHLLEEFKETPNAVLFATRSFWEGIDIQGDGLRLVIIHKIPFENPRDLLYSSKTKRIDEELGKGKHWMTYTIPDACLKLKQGVGRLIRSKTDFGVIALLDARVNFRSYGKTVMNTLPPAYKTQKLENVKDFYSKRL